MIEQAVLIGLAAWRIAAMLSYERGPFDVFLRFREALGIKHDDAGEPKETRKALGIQHGEPTEWPSNVVTEALSCVWCLGVYAAAAMYGLWQVEPVLVMVVAAASVVVVVERWCHS